LLVYSIIISIVAGYVTALIAKRKVIAHTIALGILQIAVGIFFQSKSWSLLPIWYHLSFLTLLLPCNVLGGFLRQKQTAE